MAMDTRRYNHQAMGEGVSVSASAMPGLVLLGIGALFVIVGTILLAALGIPQNPISEKPERLVGVIVLSVGGVLCITGALTAYLLKKRANKERRRMRAEKKEAERQAAEAARQHALSVRLNRAPPRPSPYQGARGGHAGVHGQVGPIPGQLQSVRLGAQTEQQPYHSQDYPTQDTVHDGQDYGQGQHSTYQEESATYGQGQEAAYPQDQDASYTQGQDGYNEAQVAYQYDQQVYQEPNAYYEEYNQSEQAYDQSYDPNNQSQTSSQHRRQLITHGQYQSQNDFYQPD